jgi:hypothetical protein
MCESMMSWHSPPPWYRVPDTLLAWQAQAEQHAAEIQDDQAMVNLYRMMLAAFEGIRDRALQDHERLLGRLEEMTPVRELHAELTALLGNLGWAHGGSPPDSPPAGPPDDPPPTDVPGAPAAGTAPDTCRPSDLEVRMGPSANDWPEAAAWVSGLGEGWRMATVHELEMIDVACPPPLTIACAIWAGGDPADHVAVWSQVYPADTDPATLACRFEFPDRRQEWCRRYDGWIHWNTRAFAVRCRQGNRDGERTPGR